MIHVDFLFVYEVRARELENICLIAAELEKRGFTTAFINSWYCLQNIEEKDKYSCEICVISAGYDKSTIQFFINHAAKYRYIVNLQWEQILVNYVMNATEKTPWDFDISANAITHICWGEKLKNRLQEKYNISESSLAVTGHTALDFYRQELRELIIPRNKLFKKYGLNINKKTLLFVSSFVTINLPQFASFETESDYNEKLTEVSVESQKILLDWFEKALIKNNNIQIIYRPHPTENDNNLLRALSKRVKNFHVISDESIKHWIINCDIIYNWASTSAIEMYVSKKPMFMLRPVKLDENLDFDIFNNCKFIKDYTGFENSLSTNEFNYEIPLDKELLLSYYDIDKDTCAFKKIADVLEQKLKTNACISDEYSSHFIKYDVMRAINIHKSIIKRIDTPYDRVMDFLANAIKLPFPNFVSRRNSYNERMSRLKENQESLNKYFEYKNDKYALKLYKRNYATEKEIRKIVNTFKAII